MTSSVGTSVLHSVLGSDIVRHMGSSGAVDDPCPLEGVEVNNADCCIARLAQLLDNGKLSDVTLIVGSRQYRCHRLLLANASSVLE